MNRTEAIFEAEAKRERLQNALAVARARVQELEEKRVDVDYRSWRDGLKFGLAVGCAVGLCLKAIWGLVL